MQAHCCTGSLLHRGAPLPTSGGRSAARGICALCLSACGPPPFVAQNACVVQGTRAALWGAVNEGVWLGRECLRMRYVRHPLHATPPQGLRGI